MPSFKCKDIGMDSGFEATAKTNEELMTKIAERTSRAQRVRGWSFGG